MVGRRVHQNIQAGLAPGRDRNHGNAQHFRQAVGVDFHAPLFHNVHHVQGQNHGLAQLDKL